MSYYKSTNSYNKIDHTVYGDFPVDFNLLFDIMYKQSPTRDLALEKAKKEWLIELISKIDGVTVEDKGGNIYCTKGEAEFYPTIVGHYDTAQDYHPEMRIFKTDKWIFGFDESTGEQCGLGLDDSVGVCFAIQMLKMMPVCKVFLPYGEERGLQGTYACDMSFFDNSLVVTQLDRRSYTTDFIKYTNGVQTFSPDHYHLIEDLMTKYGYTFNSGTATDVGGLRKLGLKVSSHNLSCGYFNEHSDTEVASVGLLINAFSFAYEMLTRLAERNIPLTFENNIKDELPYKGSKTKEKTDYLGYGGRQVTMFDYYGYEYGEDYYYDMMTGDWIDKKSKKDKDLSQSAAPKQSTYWSKELEDNVYENDGPSEAEDMYNEFMCESYPEYDNKTVRKDLKYYTTMFNKVKISQDLVDEMILDGYCPICYDDRNLHITNDLLLMTCCSHCDSVFNVPEIDQDLVEQKIELCKTGSFMFENFYKNPFE